VFFFPDGHSTFQGVDGVAAGVESGGAVGGANGDVYAGFADFEAAKAMDHGDAIDGKLLMKVRGDLLNFSQSHGLVGLVLEVEGAAVLGVVADESVKDDYGAVFMGANISCQGDRVYGFVNQQSDIGGGDGHGYTSATAYRRQEGNFVAGMQNSVPRRELLIAGGDQRRAILPQFGVASGTVSEKRFDIGLRRELYGFLGASGDVFQTAEKENFDADGLGDGRHETIVTCVRRWDQWLA